MLTRQQFCEAMVDKKIKELGRDICGLDAVDDICLGVMMLELGLLDYNLALKEHVKTSSAIFLTLIRDEVTTLTVWELLGLLPKEEEIEEEPELEEESEFRDDPLKAFPLRAIRGEGEVGLSD